MPPIPRLAPFERALDAALQAETAAQFMQAVRQGYDALYGMMVDDVRRRREGMAALEAFFAGTTANLRRRRIAELCAWPIFDKPALPQDAAELPEFLWLFAVPFLVTLEREQLAEPVMLTAEALDADELLAFVETSAALNRKASLRAFSTLLRREDIHAYGPRGLASAFVQAELGAPEVPQPLPLFMDAEVDAHRTVLYFVPCAARLPVGETELLDRSVEWTGEAAAAIVQRGLTGLGLRVERVVSQPPCSIAEALFHCTGLGATELETNLVEARRLYGPLDVIIKHPMDGFAEINGFNADGDEVVLLPAFPFFEPRSELADCVKAICEQNQMGFRGSHRLMAASPTQLLQ